LRSQNVGPLGHRRADVLRLRQQVEPAIDRLVEHHLRGSHRIHCGGLDVEHGDPLRLRGVDVTVGDPAGGFEDVRGDRARQHGLHMNVVVPGVLHLQRQALGQRQHRVLAHDVGRLQRHHRHTADRGQVPHPRR
jgi:hypothetical protein